MSYLRSACGAKSSGKWVSCMLAAVIVAGMSFVPGMTGAQEAAKKPAAKKKVKYQPWIKLCPAVAEGGPKICLVRADYLDQANQIPYSPVAIEKVTGQKEKLVVTLPHIWLVPVKAINPKTKKEVRVIRPVSAKWDVNFGIRAKIDDGKEYRLKYSFCDNFGCVATMDVNDALIKELKKGKKINIGGKNGARPLGLPFTLAGFAKAYDGKPVNQRAYETAWKNKLSALRKQRAAAIQKRRAAAKAAADKKKTKN